MADLTPGVAAALLRAGFSEWDAATLTVSGNCLAPHLRDGERVRLEPARLRPPRFGDVVLTQQPGGLRLHRLVWPLSGLGTACFRTKADRSPCLDAPCAPDALLATVAGVERGASLVATRSVPRALASLLAWARGRAGQALFGPGS